MRLATVVTEDGTTRAALQDDDAWVLLEAPDVGALVSSPTGGHAELARMTGRLRIPVADATLRAPVLRPAKILCCGLNYRDHIAETGRETPKHPTLFAKFADTLADPSEDLNVVGSSQVDWEAELAVVVRHTVHRAGRQEANDAILGYTVANDVSARDWQSRTLQWLQGKAFDRTTPIGPAIVTSDELDPADGLEIGCAIDDETVQLSSTSQLLFDSADLISYVSQFTRLSPGDIILTGTPGGVGLGRTPQRFLRNGETLRTWIEGIGELSNTMRLPEAEDS